MNLFKKVTEFFVTPSDSTETFSWKSSKLLDDRGKQIADWLFPSPVVSHGRLKGTLRIERLFDVLADQQARIERLELEAQTRVLNEALRPQQQQENNNG